MGSRILVVDDEHAVRALAARVLRREGYEVLEAGGAEEALQGADQAGSELDLLLTDLVMPGLNGQQLAARLRESRPDLRVVYMSGYPEAEIEARGMKEVGAAYITKPFSSDVLRMVVRAALE